MVAHVTQPVEFVYYTLMRRWVRSAPVDGHWGLLDDEKTNNSQVARLAYILAKLNVGSEDDVYRTLARYVRRRDGRSPISQDESWMQQPMSLGESWYLEGCMSLPQKQECVDALRHVGRSQALIDCINDFVGGQPIDGYNPTEEELRQALEAIQTQERKEALDPDPLLERVVAETLPQVLGPFAAFQALRSKPTTWY